jgi:hypothetical protein
VYFQELPLNYSGKRGSVILALVLAQLLVSQGARAAAASVTILARGIALPAGFEQEVSSSARIMQRAWQDLLGEQTAPSSAIELLLITDLIEFEELKNSHAAGLGNVSGFYSTDLNQAVVRYDARRLDESMRTVLHEISHLISTRQIGPADPWLAEGIAEYYETLAVAKDGIWIYPNTRHHHLLMGSGIPGLTEFFAISAGDWSSTNGLRYYAVSWSIVYFLMDSREGQETLRRVLMCLAANTCKPAAAAELLADFYTGGLEVFEMDWRAWLDAEKFQPHYIRKTSK